MTDDQVKGAFNIYVYSVQVGESSKWDVTLRIDVSEPQLLPLLLPFWWFYQQAQTKCCVTYDVTIVNVKLSETIII